MSWRDASRSSTSAPKGAVAATARRSKLLKDGLGPEDAERLPPALVVGAVEDQGAVQMVDLVLGDARRQPLELQPDVAALLVLGLDGHGERPLDRHADALHGEAALLLDVRLVRALDDARVDEREHLVLVLLEDEDAPQHADLVPGEAHAVRVL